VLQFNSLRKTVVEKPTMAPVTVAEANHFRILINMTHSSVSLLFTLPV